MNIAILGGAFNPPHLGHSWIIRQVLDYAGGIDELWLMPNFGRNYYGLGEHKAAASPDDRLAMTRLLEFSGVTTSTLELDNRLDGQTVKLLPFLPKQNSYTFIIGSDHLPRFSEWKDYGLLLEMGILVFPRYGYPVEGLLLPGMRVLSHQDLIQANISSTIIRNRISHGLDVGGFVPPAIFKYLNEHNLYR